jgi:hypothetical protein
MASAITRRSALGLLAVPAFAQRRQLLPVNEPTRDPALTRFVAELREAVSRRDEAALVKLLDPEVQSSFGGDEGIEEFRQWWKLDQPGSKLWPLLERLLSMGGAWDGDSYVFPYLFAKFPEDLDAFEYGVITGQGVWLRAATSVASERLRQLNYELVRIQQQGADWWEVETLDHVRGFVSSRYVRSPIDYRLIIGKRGQWRITALVAGD